jgi:hypothetical protein
MPEPVITSQQSDFAQTNLFKSEQVVYYIIHQVGGSPNVGKTVLFKLLYFCDFDYYELFEKPLTGEEYRKIDQGPAPSHFDEIIELLVEKKKIFECEIQFHGYPQKKYISTEEPNLSALSALELRLINETIERLSPMNTSQISEHSHLDIPWKVTEDKDIIDYELVFYRDPITSVREYE